MEIITTESAYREHNKRLTDQVAELRDELEGAVERALCAEALSRRRGERIEELTDILDACEATNAKHLARIDQLEQLCRDLYKCICMGDDCSYCEIQNNCAPSRAGRLGLLDGEQND